MSFGGGVADYLQQGADSAGGNGTQVWLGYGEAPKPTYVGGTPVTPTPHSGRPDVTTSIDDAILGFSALPAAEQARWSKAYFDIFGQNPSYTQLLDFYKGAVSGAAAAYQSGVRQTPLDWAQEQAVAAARLRASQGLPPVGQEAPTVSISTTSGSSTSTSTSSDTSTSSNTSTNTHLTNMDDAKAITNDIFHQLLGRKATNAEVKAFKRLLNAAERKNPTRSRTDSTTTSTGSRTTTESGSSTSRTETNPQGGATGQPGQGANGGHYEGSTWIENQPSQDPLAPQTTVSNTTNNSTGTSNTVSSSDSNTDSNTVTSGGVNAQQRAIDYAKSQEGYAEYQAAKYTAKLINMLGETVRIGG